MFITTTVVSSHPVHYNVYSIQHYVLKFVSDLRQLGGFLLVLRFPSPIKLTTINPNPFVIDNYYTYLLFVGFSGHIEIFYTQINLIYGIYYYKNARNK